MFEDDLQCAVGSDLHLAFFDFFPVKDIKETVNGRFETNSSDPLEGRLSFDVFYCITEGRKPPLK